MQESLEDVLSQFSAHVGDHFRFDKPLGQLPEAIAEDTGPQLQVFVRTPEEVLAVQMDRD